MSLDYTNTWVNKAQLTTAPSGSATTVLTNGYIFAHSTYPYKILHVTLGFLGTPANTNTTFKLQAGNADASSWIDLATYAITTANTVGTTAEVRVADASTDVTAGRIYRCVAVSTGANAGLLFEAAVAVTAVHC